MENGSINQRVKEIIAEQLGITDNSIEDTSKLEDLGGDSLDVVEAVMYLEEEFEIEIPDDDIIMDMTVSQLVEKVQALAG
jgi:acyl carrier protein